MKPIFITALLALIAFNTNAQDLIVTTKGDSLNCKITKMDKKSIYLTSSKNGVEVNTLIPRSKVQSYAYKHYGNIPSSFNTTSKKPYFPKLYVSAYGAYSLVTVKTGDGLKPDERERAKNLKNGYSINLNGVYYFHKSMGVGLLFNRYSAASSVGDLDNKLKMHYIAVSYNTRILSKSNRSGFFFDTSIGYLNYKHTVKGNDLANTKYMGGTLGTSIGLGYDIGLSEDWALSLKVSYISGSLTEYTMESNGHTQTIKPDDGKREGLSHINFSIGIRFHK